MRASKIQGTGASDRQKIQSKAPQGQVDPKHMPVGRSDAFNIALSNARRWVQGPLRLRTALALIGPYGTGKTTLARYLHEMSPHRKGRFVRLDLAAVEPSLVNASLFGHTDGAYTGSRRGGSPGLLEEAAAGTLLIEEIDSAPLEVQAKFLTITEERMYRRVGGRRDERVLCQLIVTSQRLAGLALGELHNTPFRADLASRLRPKIWLPTLAARGNDILELAQHFVGAITKGACELTPGGGEALFGYTWPGDVRELKGVVEQAALNARREGSVWVDESHLEAVLRSGRSIVATEDHMSCSALERASRLAHRLSDANESNSGWWTPQTFVQAFDLARTRSGELLQVLREEGLVEAVGVTRDRKYRWIGRTRRICTGATRRAGERAHLCKGCRAQRVGCGQKAVEKRSKAAQGKMVPDSVVRSERAKGGAS